MLLRRRFRGRRGSPRLLFALLEVLFVLTLFPLAL
jgi:hypothetical protein